MLVDLVAIVCGNTVCNSHLRDCIGKKIFKCQCCNKQHLVPEESCFISEIIQSQLQLKLNSIHNPVYDECKKEVEEAYEILDKIKNVEKDPENYIYNYFENIKRQVDLRREVLKDEIKNYSDSLIQSLNDKQNCYIKIYKDNEKSAPVIEISKKDLNELFNQFNTFEINEKLFYDTKNNIIKLSQKDKKNLFELKSSLTGNIEHYFIHDEKKLEDMFGKIIENVSILYIHKRTFFVCILRVLQLYLMEIY